MKVAFAKMKKWCIVSITKRGGVAQLVRVPPCHGGCCGFEPRLSRHFFAVMGGDLRGLHLGNFSHGR